MKDPQSGNARKSDADWRRLLTPEAYRVTREGGTERPFSHPGFPAGPARFLCVCCGAALFDSAEKFDSGCGWPSFSAPTAEAALSAHRDLTHGMIRTEIRCAQCDAHLGHVFDDGPGPTGLRYCINGVALRHQPG